MKRPARVARLISTGMFAAIMAGATAAASSARVDAPPDPAREATAPMKQAVGAGGAQDPFVAHADSALARLVQLHRAIRDIHPFLARLQPIAIVRGDTLYVFDADSSGARYVLKAKGPEPFPMPKGIRASFPLSSYGDRPSCIVSPEALDDFSGLPTIFHEFIHCAQFQTVEPRLKERLLVAREAARKNDFSWELNHPFPYQDAQFVKDYGAFLDALAQADAARISAAIDLLKKHLARTDYEYLVWQEWKEGFARYVENRIRARLGIAANVGGSAVPYDRVTFYCGGEMFIACLVRQDPSLLTDMERLFARMLGS